MERWSPLGRCSKLLSNLASARDATTFLTVKSNLTERYFIDEIISPHLILGQIKPKANNIAPTTKSDTSVISRNRLRANTVSMVVTVVSTDAPIL
jgi:hypothetical protein